MKMFKYTYKNYTVYFQKFSNKLQNFQVNLQRYLSTRENEQGYKVGTTKLRGLFKCVLLNTQRVSLQENAAPSSGVILHNTNSLEYCLRTSSHEFS